MSLTVDKQSHSYRQGLVLGLTMAEVILLIVFALLIALAAVWRSEHQENEQLRAEKAQLDKKLADFAASNRITTPLDTSEVEMLAKLRALHLSGRSIVIETAERLASGDSVPIMLSEREATYVGSIRDRMQSGAINEIDKNWRELVLASSVKNLAFKLQLAEAVQRAAPGEADLTKLAGWIVLGHQLQQNGEHDWPPIISLHEAEGYTFAKGKAELTNSFERLLKEKIIPTLLEQTAKFKVDVVEIIGHTDEQVIARRNSNLDRMLLDALKGTTPISQLAHADNAGLGLSRAVAVVRAIMLDGRLPTPQYRILPLSGAQLIGNDERITLGGGGDAPSRRRIEIRLRRSEESLGRGQP